MDKKTAIRKFQQQCHSTYVDNIGIRQPYTYPDGNPIRPVLPIHTASHSLMIVGAYPSARFEQRPSSKNSGFRVVPVADNLHPFAIEEYFDGVQVRRLTSGDGLEADYLVPLGKKAHECWITDLVKVFLYKPEHSASCADACPGFKVPVTRPKLMEYGRCSMKWLRDELELADPRLVITLGEEVARVVADDTTTPVDDLLAPVVVKPASLNRVPTIYAPHPEACRRGEKWRSRLAEQLVLAQEKLD